MEHNPIDAEIDAFAFDGSAMADLGEGSVPDEVGKFWEDAKYDAAIGKAGAAIQLQAETQDVHARASTILKQERRTPNLAPAAAAIVTDEDHRLEKRYTKGIHDGVKAARVEKSANGKWIYEFDSRNELIRGYAVEDAA